MSNSKSISFDELVKGRNSTVRMSPDKLLYAVDLVMVVTGKNRDASARVIRDLPNNVFPEVMGKQGVFTCCPILISFLYSSTTDLGFSTG